MAVGNLLYSFDPSKGETPETIARRRQTADLIASRIFGKAPANVGEGLNAIGQALIARQMQSEATDAQQAGMASVPALFGGTGANPAAGIAASIAGQPVTPSAAVASSPMGNIPPPAAPTTGKIYSNDEPSPLDPPSGQDRQAMIATILGEAGNQGPAGMNAVGSVIRNRAVSGSFGGDTPAGVVTAKNQFEPWNTPEGRARMARAAADPRQAAAADAAISSAYGEGGQAPNDPTNGATMFFDPKLQASLGRNVPPWAQGPGQDIGDHRFFGGAPMQPTQVADAGNAVPPVPMSGGVIGSAPPDQRQALAFAGPTAPQPLASPAGTPPVAPANDGEDALPANAAPAQGALPTAQAVQAASQPRSQNYGGPFANISTAELTKAAFNPWVKASSPVAAQALAAEISRRATMDQQANDPAHQLDIQAKQLAVKKAQQDLEKPDETFGVIGQDPNTGKSQYGFINTKTGSARPYNIPQNGNSPQGSIQEAMKAGVKGDDLYQFMPPDRAQTVKAMIEGRMPPPSTTAMRSPATMQLIDAANAIDPGFDATTWKSRNTFNQQFGSQAPSSIGGQKVLMSTALGHLAEVAQSAADLGNLNGLGSADLGYVANAIKNRTTGQAAIANALNDKVAKFSGEVGKLYSGSQGGGVHEREATGARLGPNLTSAELASGLQASKDLIISKQKALEDQASQIFGPDRAAKFDFFGPEGRAAVEKIDAAIEKLHGNSPAPQAIDPAALAEARRRGLIK